MASKSLDLLLQPVWFGLRANFRTPVRNWPPAPSRLSNSSFGDRHAARDTANEPLADPPRNDFLRRSFFHQRERRNAA